MKKNLAQWLSYIEALHPSEIEMGLERVKSVYAKLPQFSRTLKIFMVAGTNGKGSTVRAIEAIAKATGKRVGSYTSPHLYAYNERIQINQIPVSDEALVDAFERVEQLRSATQLTYFEFGTLAALVILAAAELDWVVLEVGLGGRLDAVNIVEPTVSIITSIALDHESWLGNTREAIGYEKAGIIRSKGICVCGDPDPPDTVSQPAGSAERYYQRGMAFDIHEHRWRWTSPIEGEIEIDAMNTSLLPQNVITAIQAVAAIGEPLDQKAVELAMSGMALPGRQQIVQEHPWIMLDVGHNPQAAQGLQNRIRQLKLAHSIERCYCILGMLADKQHSETLAELLPVIDGWWVAGLDAGTRSLLPSQLSELLLLAGAQVKGEYKTPQSAFESASKHLNAHDLLVVFGSFYTVSGIQLVT
ncbi:MAG: bifunctional tetrahydrofolate synthase/dihydrofolate synthase [Pseudomonadales bacterium]|nr:bifunctional tetrahydrofolate synthase/dihydrofolate synthase [Pseudomonadales bacterium]